MPTVSFSNQNLNIQAQNGQTILDACFHHKIDYPHGCLAGSCGVCVIKVSPMENLENPSAVEAQTLESFPENHRLACRAKIKGDIKVSAFSQ